jgi:hypothetical protein
MSTAMATSIPGSTGATEGLGAIGRSTVKAKRLAGEQAGASAEIAEIGFAYVVWSAAIAS